MTEANETKGMELGAWESQMILTMLRFADLRGAIAEHGIELREAPWALSRPLKRVDATSYGDSGRQYLITQTGVDFRGMETENGTLILAALVLLGEKQVLVKRGKETARELGQQCIVANRLADERRTLLLATWDAMGKRSRARLPHATRVAIEEIVAEREAEYADDYDG